MIEVAMGVEAKTPLEMEQFLDPTITEPRLIGIVLATGVFVSHKGWPPLVLTSVCRTGGNPTSPHTPTAERPRTHAVDIRAHYDRYTPEQEDAIRDFMRVNFPRYDMPRLEATIDNWKGIARIHGEGANRHIHVAVAPLLEEHNRIKFLV